MKYAFILMFVVLVGAAYFMWWSWCPQKPRKKRGKHRILCVGDSITFGAGVIGTRFRDSYPAILNRMLGKEYQVLNYGISGATAQEGTDHPYEASFLKAAQDTEPEICILMLGTNDTKPHNWNAAGYEAAMGSWVQRIKQFSTGPKIVLIAPPAAFSVGGEPVVYGIRNEMLRDEILPIVKKVSEKYGTDFLDMYSCTQSHPEWFGDGVHPNARGNDCIAQYLAEHLALRLNLNARK